MYGFLAAGWSIGLKRTVEALFRGQGWTAKIPRDQGGHKREPWKPYLNNKNVSQLAPKQTSANHISTVTSTLNHFLSSSKFLHQHVLAWLIEAVSLFKQNTEKQHLKFDVNKLVLSKNLSMYVKVVYYVVLSHAIKPGVQIHK